MKKNNAQTLFKNKIIHNKQIHNKQYIGKKINKNKI